MRLVADFVANNVLDSLVSKLEVFLDRHSVLDLQNHDWECNDQAAGKQNPARGEQVHVWALQPIQTPDDSCARGLNALVEACEVGELATVVGDRAHKPGLELAKSGCHAE